MDGAAFDRLSRRLGELGSRRRTLKALAGAIVGALGGGPATTLAQSCTPNYQSCSIDGQCCAGAVCQFGICMPGCRIGGGFVNAWTPEPGNVCARCTPELSTTSWSPANDGHACWAGSGSLCGSGPSICRSGVCEPANEITCQPLTVCHRPGVCDPATGLCSHPPAEAGTPCGGGEMCTGGFYSPGLICDGNGFCTAGGPSVSCAPYVCDGARCRTSCERDDHCIGGAVCHEGDCGTGRLNGQSCEVDGDCNSGSCVEGICCNESCASLCSTCATGTCLPRVCPDDTPACTTNSCNETTGLCEVTISGNSCLIAGTCYQAGESDQLGPCFVCDPVRAQDNWSFFECTTTVPCAIAFCNPEIGGCETRDLGC